LPCFNPYLVSQPDSVLDESEPEPEERADAKASSILRQQIKTSISVRAFGLASNLPDLYARESSAEVVTRLSETNQDEQKVKEGNGK
jgi:hypothetical protein